MEFDRLITNTECAELLKITPRAVVQMRDRGELPFIKLADHSRGYRYSARAITEWIASRQQTSAKGAK